MAEFRHLWVETGRAAADLTNQQYHLVRLAAADRTVNVASLDTDSGLWGVLLNKPRAGEAASVLLLGLGKVTAGAALTANALITTNGSGRAVAATSGDYVIGRALEAAAAAGDVITAEIVRPWRLTL